MPTIAIIIPTIRPERKQWMREKWGDAWKNHGVHVAWVNDCAAPYVEHEWYKGGCRYTDPVCFEATGREESELIYNFNDGVRNLGFWYAKWHLNPDIYITLDDDLRPMGNDPIQEHLDILGKKVPTSWMSSTIYPHYMRGFPYGIRTEATVTVSHGVWRGVPDLDAVTQLTQPDLQPQFYKGIVPKGAMFPLCGMNLAWTKEAAPYIYFAPMGPKTPYNRFADIWLGRRLKPILDNNGMALATGFSEVWHERASNVWKNLELEAAGLKVNEQNPFEETEYTKMWESNARKWEELMR